MATLLPNTATIMQIEYYHTLYNTVQKQVDILIPKNQVLQYNTMICNAMIQYQTELNITLHTNPLCIVTL